MLESRKIEENNGSEEEYKTALTTKHIADAFKWSSTSIRKTIGSLGICEKGLSNQVRVGGRNTRVIFFEPRRLEKRLREFVMDYTPNAVSDVTGVAVSPCDAPKSPLFYYSKTDVLHRKTVTAATSVTKPSDYPHYPERGEEF